jgi:hypothetical protein
VQQLRATQPQQVEKIGVEPDPASADTGVKVGVETGAPSEHAVDELANPAAISRVELRGSAVECRIEQLASAEIGANVGGRDSRVRNATVAAVNGHTAR